MKFGLISLLMLMALFISSCANLGDTSSTGESSVGCCADGKTSECCQGDHKCEGGKCELKKKDCDKGKCDLKKKKSCTGDCHGGCGGSCGKAEATQKK